MRNHNQITGIFWKGAVVICLLASAGFVIVKDSYPQGYFGNPVNRQILLSGTFGELRSNHFHAGLDIKSKNGSVGEDILATGPGFISRISVQSGGYGNVLYMDHPNGYTTVYAHLHRFTDEVAEYIKRMQYELQRFEVNLYPRPDQFVFKKGERIGYLGNSGSSSGPHLHFEIRKTSNQLPINPLLFGYHVVDELHPGIRMLKVYHLDQDMHFLRDENHAPVYVRRGLYRLRDTLRESTSQIAFAMKVYDQMNGASNQNGVYAIAMAVDDIPQYSFELNSIPFSQTRYLNAHIDYSARQNGGGYFHRCFRLPGNALDIYHEQDERGVISLSTDKARKVTITALDKAGNASDLIFFVKKDTAGRDVKAMEHHYDVDYLRSQQINTPDLQVSFEPHTFYQDHRLYYHKDASARSGLYAPVHTITPDDIPLHRYFDMTILSSGIPEHLKSKAFIAEVTGNGRLVSWGGVVHGDYIHSRVRSLGAFSVALDTIPPEIIPITFKSNMKGMSRMRFRIGDSQSVSGQAEYLNFEARVDGKWILMEYEGKRAMLTHWFDDRIGPGDHELVLRVWDDRGNETKLVRRFVR